MLQHLPPTSQNSIAIWCRYHHRGCANVPSLTQPAEFSARCGRARGTLPEGLEPLRWANEESPACGESANFRAASGCDYQNR